MCFVVKYLQLTCNLAGIQTRVPGRTVRETRYLELGNGAPGMGSMPILGPWQALTFNNINRLTLLGARANPICGHPNGLPRKGPSSGSHGPSNTVLGGY